MRALRRESGACAPSTLHRQGRRARHRRPTTGCRAGPPPALVKTATCKRAFQPRKALCQHHLHHGIKCAPLPSVAVVPPTGSESFQPARRFASDVIQAPIALVHRHHAFRSRRLSGEPRNSAKELVHDSMMPTSSSRSRASSSNSGSTGSKRASGGLGGTAAMGCGVVASVEGRARPLSTRVVWR